MAQKPLSTAAAQRMNLVAQDEIWKYRLKAEGEARQNWAQNWGFLTTPVEELLKGEEEPPTLKPKIELPQRFRIRPVTPVEKYIKASHADPDAPVDMAHVTVGSRWLTLMPFRSRSLRPLQSRRRPRASSAGDPGCRT
ncbi:ciliary microtubule inner protein 1 isoform X3 [Canis lupus baileyi]|uniref:uncharacterized protein C20orf85 homolog isoform X4 n=1 Tax=Canis lupus familiaris TaxID=9615 RepID=UPI0006B3DC45|nr:uncharacterized protein C20orf85 homolog isoform X4 [Canis lupus familiaris]XP_025326293.2 uncharacterized protein C20orf85 homolog isoform X4 [Canis lupus dingo]XP_038290124.1 uncharacterized protein C20orf85 homolog isoform X4 [Canis lupus familiaris]XP_038428627.1 uncharacterized protein C20orf85 homolog isoform X4 [Canis lupus familiaris]|eukprot:XP_013962369.1 uncharacterized protein C20orf85 homolog isoform X3 [Canis lupus familiaris]